MSIIEIKKADIIEKIETGDVDKEIMGNACIEAYSLYGSKYGGFIVNAIKHIYNKLTYQEASSSEACENIGSYVNDSKLLDILLTNHKLITSMILGEHQMFANVASYIECKDDVARFYVDGIE